MKVSVIVPQIGQSIAEATIVKWFKKQGDSVSKGETLLEIGTDKINTEIPAPESGVVERLLIPEGETIPVGTEIAVIKLSEESGAGASWSAGSQPAGSGPLTSLGDKEARAPAGNEERRHSPFVRKLAQEHAIDLSAISGTGEGGRITKEDVLKIVEQKEQPTISEERVAMSRMRKLIADHMAHSKRTAADLTTFFEVDMQQVSWEREKSKEMILSQRGIKLTYLPFVLYATVKALKAFPVLNSSIDGDDMIYHRDVHLGIAVAMEDGLIVPVIRDADQKNVLELARAAHDLSERARSKRLTPDDLQGGTFSVTNPGVFGALMGTPIIHQPQVAILGLGAVVKRAVVIDDAIAIRPMAYLSLTYDHRALDGSDADGFLAQIKHTLEKECPSLHP